MGLGGRKVKQRIPDDPRNLSWADDAARFGSNYLAKFGWNSSKGLGVSGEGSISHVKVSQKLDMLGIGAAHQQDPNRIAWKQNSDFENLLKRLNGDAAVEDTPFDGFKKADDEQKNKGNGKQEEDEDEGKTAKKRKRKQDKEKPKKRKKNEEKEDFMTSKLLSPAPMPRETSSELKKTIPRHRAHRARAIAAKNIASKSVVHISEILGVAPTPLSTTPLTSATSTPQESYPITPPGADIPQIEKITTSTQSIHDYFREKLKSKLSTSSSNAADSDVGQEVSYNVPRGGLGLSSFGSMINASSFLSSYSALTPSISQIGRVVEAQRAAEFKVMNNSVDEIKSKYAGGNQEVEDMEIEKMGIGTRQAKEKGRLTQEMKKKRTKKKKSRGIDVNDSQIGVRERGKKEETEINDY